jgi:hypothetical protein
MSTKRHTRPNDTPAEEACNAVANTRETLAAVLETLRVYGIQCDVFGGWAAELLGLREPWQHKDIDLIYRSENLAAFDVIEGDFRPVPLKRFRHKRAFMFRDTLCEIVLVRDADIQPVTLYWGEVPFHWDRPLLHGGTVDLCGTSATVVSAANLTKHHRLYNEIQPDRWRNPASLDPMPSCQLMSPDKRKE